MNWQKVSTVLQWVFAFVGAGICIITVIGFASSQPDLWPLPALYFIEIGLMGLLAVACVSADKAWASTALWGVVGVLMTFVILGGFSIGPFLFPALLAFASQALLKTRQLGRSIPIGLGLALLAALVQAGAMFGAIALGA